MGKGGVEGFKNIVPKVWKPTEFKKDPNFKQTNSIFAKFNLEEPEDILEALDTDFICSSLKKFFPAQKDKEDPLQALKEFLLSSGYYIRIQNVYRYYQAQLSFPKVNFDELIEVIKKQTKILDQRVKIN